MMNADPLSIFWWSLTALAVLWLGLPAIGGLLGLTRFRIVPVPPEFDRNVPVGSRGYRAYARMIKELGGVYIGLAKERYWLAGVEWVFACDQRVYRMREFGVYAIIYRFSRIEPFQVSFITCCSDGGLVWTANISNVGNQTSRDYFRSSYETDKLELLLKHHQGAVEYFLSFDEQREPIERLDLAEICKLIQATSRRHGRIAICFLAALRLIIMAVIVNLGYQKIREVGTPNFLQNSFFFYCYCEFFLTRATVIVPSWRDASTRGNANVPSGFTIKGFKIVGVDNDDPQ